MRAFSARTTRAGNLPTYIGSGCELGTESGTGLSGSGWTRQDTIARNRAVSRPAGPPYFPLLTGGLLVRVQPGELRTACKGRETKRAPCGALRFRTQLRTSLRLGPFGAHRDSLV